MNAHAEPVDPRVAAEGSRVAYLDHLKVALTALVIVHHLAISFGADGSWYYVDAHAPRSLWLSLRNQIDDAFFMGLFFFIAGSFTPPSYARKGARRFLVERTLRLLVPAIAFGVLVAPWLEYVKRTSLGRPTPPFCTYYFERVAELGEFDLGPLWFLWALWLFSLAYVIWRVLVRDGGARWTPAPSDRALAALVLLLGASTFVVRLWWPIGRSLAHLQLAYAPQYAALFALGALGWRGEILAGLRRRQLLPWALVATAGTLAIVAVARAVGDDAELRLGGLHGTAAAWALGESAQCVGLCVCLLIIFREWLARRSRLGDVLASGAFAAYIVHAPIVVAVARRLAATSLPPTAKLAAAVAIAVPTSFVLALALRRVPGLRRVL
jgi:hypothetical protein